MSTTRLQRTGYTGRLRLIASLLGTCTILALVLPLPQTRRAPEVAYAAAQPGTQVTSSVAAVASVAATISPFRRQPFAGTSATPTTVTYDPQTHTIELTTGHFTLPTLRQALLDTYVGTALYTETLGLLTQSAPGSTEWQLNANLTIRYAAALEVSTATATWLRLTSSSALPAPAIRNSGYLVFRGTKVTSWNAATNAVDDQPSDGRGFIATASGGRTDLYNSEVAFLGWQGGDTAGLSWRGRRQDADPTSGATGDVHDSSIHDMYSAIQGTTAFGLWVARTTINRSSATAVDIEAQSTGLIIEDTTVMGSERHGIDMARNCYGNIIQRTTVTANGRYGIIVERRSGSDAQELTGAAVKDGANQILNNVVSEQQDGIVLFQASGNIVTGNRVSQNDNGIRLSATPLTSTDGTPDSLTRQNLIATNEVFDNRTNGITLYARADNNTIRDNVVRSNGRRDDEPLSPLGSGIYIKAGGNIIGPGNLISNNGYGVSLVALDAAGQTLGSGDDPDTLAATATNDNGLPAGSNTTIAGNHIWGSKSRGLRMDGANQNTVQDNEIDTNATEGIYIDDGSENLFARNYIHHNGAPRGGVNEGVPDTGSDGIQIKGADAIANQLTANRITANGRNAIKIGTQANNNIAPPIISAVQTTFVEGTALPNATIEVFSDPRSGCGATTCGDEAALFVGSATAGADGAWQLATATTSGVTYSATQTDTSHNTSALSGKTVAPTVSIGAGRKGEPTIFVSGSASSVSLSQIKPLLQEYSAQVGRPEYADLLTDDGVIDGKRTWTLHMSLFISPTVSLAVQGGAQIPETQRVDWLRLFSNPGPDPAPNPSDPDHPIYDATVFATIKAYNSNLLFEDTSVTSWDTTTNRLDEDKHDGRAFVLAKYDSEMSIIRSNMSYLGYADGEAYGVSWRDVNDSSDPETAPRRTRVTGSAIDSTFSHNYYGIYTFQAQDMVFRNNKLFSNIQYGFDPHDFTHDVLVEGNEAYDNGSHGFIISRGCANFVFRNNSSHENKVKEGSKNPSAHGFMLDPGADPLKAGVPQAPSVFNLIENNSAYGNDGYAVRVYGSNNNTIRGNQFSNNRAGITLEKGSTGNLVAANSITNSVGEPVIDGTTGQLSTKGGYGVYAFQGADGNTIIGNTITGNINTGIYLKTGSNTVSGNTISSNREDGIGTLVETESELPADPPQPNALLNAALTPGAYINDQEPGSWAIAAATAPTNNAMFGNSVTLNLDQGIALKGATNTQLTGNMVASNATDGIYIANGSVDTTVAMNTVDRNGNYGIKVNGADVSRTSLSQNSVTGNATGGIAVTGGANNGIAAPAITVVSTDASQIPQSNAIAGSWIITGTARPGARIELYSDAGQQAAMFEGATVADDKGQFSFVTSGPPERRTITATATDALGNTSSLSKPAKKSWTDGEYLVYLPRLNKKK